MTPGERSPFYRICNVTGKHIPNTRPRRAVPDGNARRVRHTVRIAESTHGHQCTVPRAPAIPVRHIEAAATASGRYRVDVNTTRENGRAFEDRAILQHGHIHPVCELRESCENGDTAHTLIAWDDKGRPFRASVKIARDLYREVR